MSHQFRQSRSTSEAEVRKLRINRLGRAMTTLCTAAILALPASVIFYFLTASSRTLLSAAGLMAGDVTLALRLAAAAIACIPLAVLCYGLLRARRSFREIARGNAMSVPVVKGVRDLSIAVLVSTLLKPVTGAALGMLFSVATEAGRYSLSLQLGSDTLIALIVAGTLAILASVLADAIEIAQENEQFV